MSQDFVALVAFYRSAAGKPNRNPVGAQTKKQNPTTVGPQLPIAGGKALGVLHRAGGWALRVIHQYISKGGTLRWLSCSSLASQNHFSKKEPVSCNWNQDLSVAPQQETSLPAAGGVHQGPGSVAPQPRLTPSHHEAAPWWGFLPFPLCLHFSGTLSSVVV